MYAIKCYYNGKSRLFAFGDSLWSGSKDNRHIVGTKYKAFTCKLKKDAQARADSLKTQFPDTDYQVVKVTDVMKTELEAELFINEESHNVTLTLSDNETLAGQVSLFTITPEGEQVEFVVSKAKLFRALNCLGVF